MLALYAVHHVGDEAQEEHHLHGADQRVLGHELGALVEGDAAVVEEDEGVDAAVHHQEADKEKAREGHPKLLDERRSEESFTGHGGSLERRRI